MTLRIHSRTRGKCERDPVGKSHLYSKKLKLFTVRYLIKLRYLSSPDHHILPDKLHLSLPLLNIDDDHRRAIINTLEQLLRTSRDIDKKNHSRPFTNTFYCIARTDKQMDTLHHVCSFVNRQITRFTGYISWSLVNYICHIFCMCSCHCRRYS